MGRMNKVGADRLNRGRSKVPNPAVTGPIPATAKPGDRSHEYPFFSAMVDLAAYDYVEEEFFLEGTANHYDTTLPLATAKIIDKGHPYQTRIIVRRPGSPDHFNGTVVMEWQDPAPGHDMDAGWLYSHNHFMRRRYAWVGVSALQKGIHTALTGLREWSSSRYGKLDVTQNGTFHNDELCFDIFSQAAQAVRSPVGVDPMGGLHVERVIAIGLGSRLVVYHNSIHPLAGVFDAFSIALIGGPLRTDLDVKVFKLLSEFSIALGGEAAVRQPDSAHFRRWEVAGAAAHDFHLDQEYAPLVARDLGGPPPGSDCDQPPFSRIPLYFVFNAALEHLVLWLEDGIQPPSAPEIRVLALEPSVVIARDSHRNALGGIRLSQRAVATATNTGVNSGPTGSFCQTFGSFEPFDKATLRALYRNHRTYVLRVILTTQENLRNGFIVLEDAIATVQEAERSSIP